MRERYSDESAFEQIKLGGSLGIVFTAAAGILTIAGVGNTNNEDLTLDFETSANAVIVRSGTGVQTLDFGTINVTATGTWKTGTHSIGGAMGITLAGAAGVFTMSGLGNTNNEDLVFDFEATANTVGISSGTGVTLVDWGSLNLTTTGFGTFRLPIVAKTANYTTTTSDHTITCGAGNQTFTITLITAVGNTGLVYNIKNVGTGTITVDGNASETIDGATTQVISTQYDSIMIQSDGTEWWII